MRVDGRDRRTIRVEAVPGQNPGPVFVVDQTKLPHAFETLRIDDAQAMARAIADMVVRGAPLIGVSGAYGMALAMREDATDPALAAAFDALNAARPTAVNLRWALERMRAVLRPLPPSARADAAYAEAARMADEDVATCEAIGGHGAALIAQAAAGKGGGRVNVLTHCNAGWLATVDWGTALAPIYKARRAGIDVHVWVDETRPRGQGAALTAWELAGEGVAHTVIVDNAGGHLMQHGQVDLCLVGSDRTTRAGDVCNKVGTYLKALAAHDNGVPFYAALPASTIDWRIADGVRDIPIEDRGEREVTHVTGLGEDGRLATVRVTPPGVRAANPAFDVTPARLVTGIVTERGVAQASEAGLAALFPEHHEERAA